MRPSRSEPCLLQLIERVPAAPVPPRERPASPRQGASASSLPCEPGGTPPPTSAAGGLACALCRLRARRGALEELSESLRWLAPHIEGFERNLAEGRYRGDEEEPGAAEFLDAVEAELGRIQAAWSGVEAQLRAARRAVGEAD